MSRMLKIAVREYLAYVKTIGFWLSMLTAPALIALSVFAPVLMSHSTPPPAVAVVDLSPVTDGIPACVSLHRPCPPPVPNLAEVVERRLAGDGVVLVEGPISLRTGDAAGQREVVGPYFTGENARLPVLSVPQVSGAVTATHTGLGRPLDYVVYLSPDPHNAAHVSVRVWSRTIGTGTVRNTVTDAVEDWNRITSLSALGVPEARSREIMTSLPSVESYSIQAASGRISFRDRLPGIAGFAMGIALWSAAMTGAGILLNSVIEEKSSRILEVLLSSASVPQIMGGKILGVAAVTTTVLGLWGSIGGLVMIFRFPGAAADVAQVLLTHGLIFYFLFYFLAGYLMYATLFITVGAFCETSREAQTLLGPMMIVLIVPMLFLTQAITHPDSPLLRVLSWIPTFTPFLMAARAASQPPLWEILGTGALMLATVAAEIWVAGRAFRAGALSTSRFDPRYFFASLLGRSTV